MPLDAFDKWFIEFEKTDLSQHNHNENCRKAWDAAKADTLLDLLEQLIKLRSEKFGHV